MFFSFELLIEDANGETYLSFFQENDLISKDRPNDGYFGVMQRFFQKKKGFEEMGGFT